MSSTHYLIAVQMNGEYKMACYRQDRYLMETVGVSILDCVSDAAFVEQMKVDFAKTELVGDEKGLDADWIFKNMTLSAEDRTKLKSNLEFATNGAWCEYCYVIDFDKNTFEVFLSSAMEPTSIDERFPCLKPDDYYNCYGIKLAKEYKLDNLPTEKQFIAELEIVRDTHNARDERAKELRIARGEMELEQIAVGNDGW